MVDFKIDWKLLLAIPGAVWNILQISRTVREWGAHHPLVYRWSLILSGLSFAFASGFWLHSRWGRRVREWGKRQPVVARWSLILSGLSILILAGLSIAFFPGSRSVTSTVATSTAAPAKPPDGG
jgi:hypothetical protein